jgi:hypothetical protein
MIETICQNCGNQKPIEDSNIGRTFKCPNCSQPVKVESIISEFSNEPLSKTSTFEEEISRAEKEKEELLILEKSKSNSKIFLVLGGIFLALGFILMLATSESFYFGLVIIIIGFLLFAQGNNMQSPTKK